MKWLKLDNTAKIYPFMLSADNQNMFRVNAELYEAVDCRVLHDAINLIAPRFPMLTMRLKKGFFWYYLESNSSPIPVMEESPLLLDTVTLNNVNGYNFRVSYFNRRISIDFYHILCDGGAAMEFFKCLLFHYFRLLGKEIAYDNSIPDINIPTPIAEYEDSFSSNFTKTPLKSLSVKELKSSSAYILDSQRFSYGKGVITLTADSNLMLAHAKSLGCSVTEYLSAQLMLAASDTQKNGANLDNFSIFLPINIRRCYNSRSMRNFSLFARASMDLTGDNVNLQAGIDSTHTALIHATDKNILDKRINATVTPAKLLVMRLMPLTIKSAVFKIGNKVFGKAKKSCSFSNLGVLKIPCLEPFIEKFHFQMNTNKLVTLNATCSTFKDKLTLSFLRSTVDKSIIEAFTRRLLNDGLEISINSNDWEVKCND